jgi:retron-type reverse transcriptase
MGLAEIHSTKQRNFSYLGVSRSFASVMRGQLEKYLREEADKHIARYMSKLRTAAQQRDRYEKLTGKAATVPSQTMPRRWDLDQQFNPFYVRSHAASIAHGLASRIRAGEYSPRPSLKVHVPKPTGGTRGISIFTVVDSAVSTWLFSNLSKRNYAGFSNYAYAYRIDRNAQHAIEHIAAALARKRRAYILEYDFTKYFDSVTHDYLKRVIATCCKVSPRENRLISAFLSHRYADGLSDYAAAKFKTSQVGFPQGATISLFLANMACLELDRDIEGTGASFARFADDTVILCDDYNTAHRLAGIMLEHGNRSGAAINIAKSPGISLVADPSRSELRAKESFTFLGHQISPSGIHPSAKAIARMKRRTSVIIYQHLLLHPKHGVINPRRFSQGIDWDLVTCINELRRYLYGPISCEHLDGALKKKRPLRLSTCALSFFPLIRWAGLFADLDGWLADVLFRAYEKRRRIFEDAGTHLPRITKEALIDGSWYFHALPNETALPSAVKSWRYARKCYLAFGVRVYSAPPPYNW